jgi:phage-related minor tail protein
MEDITPMFQVRIDTSGLENALRQVERQIKQKVDSEVRRVNSMHFTDRQAALRELRRRLSR